MFFDCVSLTIVCYTVYKKNMSFIVSDKRNKNIIYINFILIIFVLKYYLEMVYSIGCVICKHVYVIRTIE